MFLIQIIRRQVRMGSVILLQEIRDDLVESILAGMLLQRLLVNVIHLLVKSLDLPAQFLVVGFVAIFTLYVSAQFLGQFHLQLAHGLDSLSGHFQRGNEILLGNLFHLSFHHHDVFGSGTYHDIHVCLFHLLESGIHHVLSIDTSNADLRNGAFERYIRTSHGSGSCEARQCVGLVYAVSRKQHDLYINFGMIIRGEERTQSPVYQAGGENLVITRLAFALGETTWETARGTILLAIIHLQRHEVCTRNGILCCTNSGQQHCVSHTEHCSAISLLCNFSGLNRDGSPIRQLNCFRNYVHQI